MKKIVIDTKEKFLEHFDQLHKSWVDSMPPGYLFDLVNPPTLLSVVRVKDEKPKTRNSSSK